MSEEAEFDGLDDEATHLVGIEQGALVATCRLLFEQATCRLGRMAVAPERRRGGVGRRLMAAAEKQARERGAAEIVIHAQRRAEPFYASRWFVAEGEGFDEEGIEHVLMRKRIRRD